MGETHPLVLKCSWLLLQFRNYALTITSTPNSHWSASSDYPYSYNIDRCCHWSLLYNSTILRSPADPLHSYVIIHVWPVSASSWPHRCQGPVSHNIQTGPVSSVQNAWGVHAPVVCSWRSTIPVNDWLRAQGSQDTQIWMGNRMEAASWPENRKCANTSTACFTRSLWLL